jgi:hypothetical protein
MELPAHIRVVISARCGRRRITYHECGRFAHGTKRSGRRRAANCRGARWPSRMILDLCVCVGQIRPSLHTAGGIGRRNSPQAAY